MKISISKKWTALSAVILFSLAFSLSAMAAVSGHLDGADPATIVGWAWDSSDADKTVDVTIEAASASSGKTLRTWNIAADDYRKDVEEFTGSDNHGFFCSVNWSELPEDNLVLTAYVLSGDQKIPLQGTVTYKRPASGTAAAADSKKETIVSSASDKTDSASGSSTSVPQDKLHYGPGFANTDKDSGSVNSEWKKGESLGMFTTTGYCNCELCSGGSGLTYSGTTPQPNHTIAADINLYPIGTKLIIDDVVYTVEDMGTGVNGKVIDIYYAEHSQAVAHGTKTQEVFRAVAK